MNEKYGTTGSYVTYPDPAEKKKKKCTNENKSQCPFVSDLLGCSSQCCILSASTADRHAHIDRCMHMFLNILTKTNKIFKITSITFFIQKQK